MEEMRESGDTEIFEEPANLVATLHAGEQTARRNLRPDEVAYVFRYGQVLHRTGVIFYFLAARDVPRPHRKFSDVQRLIGTTLLVGDNGAMITAYRNQRALRVIKKKNQVSAGYGTCPQLLNLIHGWPGQAEGRPKGHASRILYV
jgi:hypothetical protein